MVRFHTMVISDDKQRVMPAVKDCRKGQRLAYPEAVLLTDPTNPNHKGEVAICKFFHDGLIIFIKKRIKL